MTQGKVRFFAEQRDFGDKVAIYIREDGPSEGRDSVALIVFQKVEEGFRPDPALTVRTSEAQELMDALWSAGLRPAEGAGSAVKAKPEKLKSLGHGVTTTTSPHDVVGAKTRTPRDTWNKRLGHGVTMAEKTENLASMRVPAEFSPKVEKASHRTPRVPPLYVYQSKGQKGSADRHGSYMRLTAKPVHLFTGLLQRQSLANR